MKDVAKPFNIDQREIFTTVSIGIAVSTLGYQHPEEFLRDADTAMYRAKSGGKARFEIFDAEMRASVTRRLEIETDLRYAIEREEFRNYYQPIISLESGRIVGFEALLRWQHPTRGLVGPNEFIPVAEDTGLIIPIGEWVLRKACGQISEWQEQYPLDPPLTISVNISGKQFAQSGLIRYLVVCRGGASGHPAGTQWHGQDHYRALDHGNRPAAGRKDSVEK